MPAYDCLKHRRQKHKIQRQWRTFDGLFTCICYLYYLNRNGTNVCARQTQTAMVKQMARSWEILAVNGHQEISLKSLLSVNSLIQVN